MCSPGESHDVVLGRPQVSPLTERIVFALPYQFYFSDPDHQVGGHRAHVMGLIDAMIDQGFAIEVVSDSSIPGIDSSAVRTWHPRFTRLRAGMAGLERRLSRPSTRLMARLVAYVRRQLFVAGMFWTTWRRARQRDTVLVYVRHNTDGFAPALAARVARRPLALEVNTPASMGSRMSHEGSLRGSRRPSVGWRERLQYRAATVIAAVSPVVSEWIAAATGPDGAGKIIVNPNGVNPTRFKPTGAGFRVRGRLGIGPDEIVFGMAASFHWYNGIDDLIESFARAQRATPDTGMRLMLIGGGEQLAAIRESVDRRGLSHSVLLAGRVPYDEMPAYLEACDVLVSHFNFKEVTPHICAIKQFEYMAMARPVLATVAGTANFAVRTGENGRLVEQGDVDGFARAMIALATDPAERERLGQQGRRDVGSPGTELEFAL